MALNKGGAQLPYRTRSNQALVSSPLPQRRKAADVCYTPMTNPRHTPNPSSSLNFPNLDPIDHSQTTSGGSKSATSGSRSRCRQTRDRRTEKRTRNSKRTEHTSSLGRALSQMAVEVPHIFVPDAAVFATRTVEQRREEATIAGKIKRPLNAFMLYRRSYQNVAKTCCTRNNHQQVSAVCGDSWTTCEPSEVVSEFNRLATIERQMHELAFPNYKYDPLHTKKGDDKDTVSSQPSTAGSLVDIGGSDLTRGGPAKRNRRKPSKYDEFILSGAEGYSQAIVQQSTFQERTAAVAAAHPYWTTPALQTHAMPYSEEQHVYPDPSSFPQYGMPSGEDQVVSRSAPPVFQGLYGDAMGHSFNYTEIFIDPSLLPCQPGVAYGFSNGPVAVQEQWHPLAGTERSHTEAVMPEMDMEASYDAYLRGTERDWKVEQLDEPSQFEDWMSQTDM